MEKASLGKRLLSITYDVLIVFFIIIVSTFIIQEIIILLKLTTLEHVQISKDETIVMIPTDSIATLILKNLWVVISFFYFGYYWTKRGQTLGMKVWKVKAITYEGNLMMWGQALKRYLYALLGLGLFWMIFDKDKLPLQDRMSKTKLIKVT